MKTERKFLVKELPDLRMYSSSDLIQAYISIDPEVRIRSRDGLEFFLTIKGDGSIQRYEYEWPLACEQFMNLFKNAKYVIKKTRYYIPLNKGLLAELDIYHVKLQDLVTVEVEFPDKSTANAFVSPDWFGKEVTKDKHYKNKSLAANGLPRDLKRKLSK